MKGVKQMMKSRVSVAKEKLKNGYNCCQAVLLTVHGLWKIICSRESLSLTKNAERTKNSFLPAMDKRMYAAKREYYERHEGLTDEE